MTEECRQNSARSEKSIANDRTRRNESEMGFSFMVHEIHLMILVAMIAELSCVLACYGKTILCTVFRYFSDILSSGNRKGKMIEKQTSNSNQLVLASAWAHYIREQIIGKSFYFPDLFQPLNHCLGLPVPCIFRTKQKIITDKLVMSSGKFL